MFESLKNKIKEETGGDLNAITSLVTSVTPKTINKGRHSRQGSATSLGSFTIDGSKDEVGSSILDLKLADGRTITPKEFKRLESKEDEWRKKLHKKDEEYANQIKKVEDTWKRKVDEKEKEFQKLLSQKETENNTFLSEIRSLQTQVLKLQEEVKLNIEYKAKICQYQEDLDQLEGFKTQEMAKIKHLLLQKEQLLLEKDKTVSEQNQKIVELNAEIRRLLEADRKLSNVEDQLEDLRHSSEQEKSVLTSRLATEEESNRHLKDRLAVLEARCRTGCLGLGGELTPDDRVQGLLGERALLERLLSEAHEHLSEVKTSWSSKITSLETQVGRLSRQASEESAERRQAEKDRDDLSLKLQDCELDLANSRQAINNLESCKAYLEEEIDDLKTKIANFNHGLNNSITTAQEKTLVSSAENEERIRECKRLKKENFDLTEKLNREKSEMETLHLKLEELQSLCESERSFNIQIREEAEMERREKDDLMMRNAEVSQEAELVRQELRTYKQDVAELNTKIIEMEDLIRDKSETLAKERIAKDMLTRQVNDLEGQRNETTALLTREEELKEKYSDIENQLLEKNKAIKNLQQRVSDMKKTMQRELKVPSRSIDPGGQNGDGMISSHGPAILTPSCPDDSPEDVNFKYLKHVLFKFLTCRDYEAHHLTRAVATLLRFTSEEEQLLRETMDWRMSWFGSRPKINTKAHPPS